MSRIFTKNDIPDIIDSFNKHIKKIVKILDVVIVNNVAYDTLRRRLNIVINESPIFLLQNGGYEIYNKRDFIINNNLGKLFEKDIAYYSNEIDISDDLKNSVDEKEMDKLFSIMKKCWDEFSDKEKKYINKIFKTLLSEYSKYKSIK